MIDVRQHAQLCIGRAYMEQSKVSRWCDAAELIACSWFIAVGKFKADPKELFELSCNTVDKLREAVLPGVLDCTVRKDREMIDVRSFADECVNHTYCDQSMDARLNDAAGLIACAQLIASGKFTATSSELFHLVGDALDALYEDFFSK